MAAQLITLQTLELMLKTIIKSYAQRGVDHVDVTGKDFYLSMGTPEMFDVYQTPCEPLPVGSLADDMAELKKLLIDPDRIATAVDIERLGNVLRAVSELI